MAVADMLPTMDDAALASLMTNARRLETGAEGPRRDQAAQLVPLIEAELAEREARKPPKVTPVRKRKPVAAQPGA